MGIKDNVHFWRKDSSFLFPVFYIYSVVVCSALREGSILNKIMHNHTLSTTNHFRMANTIQEKLS